jgi:hypothetical protein
MFLKLANLVKNSSMHWSAWEAKNGCRRTVLPGLQHQNFLHTARVRDRHAVERSRKPPRNYRNWALVWRRRRIEPNKKSGITASKLRGLQTRRLSYCMNDPAANVPQENSLNSWKIVHCLAIPAISGVLIRYGVVSFMGFQVHFPFLTPQVFRQIFSGRFRMPFNTLDRNEAADGASRRTGLAFPAQYLLKSHLVCSQEGSEKGLSCQIVQ